METYSRFKQVNIRNFRCLGNIELDMSDNNIIVLKAGNEVGKTSVISAIDLCLNNRDRDVKDNIRDGTNGFGVRIVTEDGHTIDRVRTTSDNSYVLMKDGKTLFEVNKMSSASVPPVIDDVARMSIEPETKESLNIRTYADNLMFVFTKDTDNYKIMYNALKVEKIANAIKLALEDNKSLTDKSNSNSYNLSYIKSLIENNIVIDTEPCEAWANITKKHRDTTEAMIKLLDMKEDMETVSKKIYAFGNIDKLIEINPYIEVSISTALRNFETIKNNRVVINRLEGVRGLNEINLDLYSSCEAAINKRRDYITIKDKVDKLSYTPELISYDSLNRLNKVADYKNEITAIKATVEKLSSLPSEVSIDVIERLQKLNEQIQKCRSLEDNIRNIKEELKTDEEEYEALRQAELAELHNGKVHYSAEYNGYVKECENCHELVVMTNEELNEAYAEFTKQ